MLYRLAKAYVEVCDMEDVVDRWNKLKDYIECTANRTNSIPGSCPDAARILQFMKSLENR